MRWLAENLRCETLQSLVKEAELPLRTCGLGQGRERLSKLSEDELKAF